jgi:hypothetical protein
MSATISNIPDTKEAKERKEKVDKVVSEKKKKKVKLPPPEEEDEACECSGSGSASEGSVYSEDSEYERPFKPSSKLSDSEKLTKILSYLEVPKKPREKKGQNSGKKWTDKEDELVKKEVNSGGTIKTIAEKLGRSEYAVQIRLTKLKIAN